MPPSRPVYRVRVSVWRYHPCMGRLPAQTLPGQNSRRRKRQLRRVDADGTLVSSKASCWPLLNLLRRRGFSCRNRNDEGRASAAHVASIPPSSAVAGFDLLGRYDFALSLNNAFGSGLPVQWTVAVPPKTCPAGSAARGIFVGTSPWRRRRRPAGTKIACLPSIREATWIGAQRHGPSYQENRRNASSENWSWPSKPRKKAAASCANLLRCWRKSNLVFQSASRNIFFSSCLIWKSVLKLKARTPSCEQRSRARGECLVSSLPPSG
ncbi:hypothetical protein MSPGM_37900 [Methylorubrum sp. GM97]|nr:hypothetical protein MSPGM_37900 [Methylorubrum sp. GM97]